MCESQLIGSLLTNNKGICTIGYSREIFDSLTDIFDIAMSPNLSMNSFERQRRINGLDHKLRSSKITTKNGNGEEHFKSTTIAQLYQIAGLIYLGRVTAGHRAGEFHHGRL